MSSTAFSRRSFLGASALGALGLAGLAPAGAPAATGKGAVKFCLFADLHYYPGVFPNDTPEFLEKILRRAEAADVDFVIHLGDLVHIPKKLKSFVDRYNDFHIRTYHTIGNHEDDGNAHEETLEAYRLASGHYFFDVNGFRFVVCDPNYIRFADGTVRHYSNANYTKREKGSVIAWMPQEQIDWLQDTLEGSPHPCVICSHQSFERERNGVPNYRAVRDVINGVNARHPGRVRFVLNGHEHIDNLRVLDNVLYFDFNSANFQYYGKTHDKYPADYMKAHTQAPHTIAWTEPLSAIVTLTAEGGIRIEGSRADWLFGVTPVQAGYTPFEWDGTGRTTRPVVQSASLSFDYGRAGC